MHRAFRRIAAAQGTLFVGTWPHTGAGDRRGRSRRWSISIDLSTGASAAMQLSDDRKTLYVIATLEKSGIEVIDVATRKVTNSFVLDEGAEKDALQRVGS